MKIAQILYGRVHHIFEADAIPDWPPDPDGNPIILIDVTNTQAAENDGYNPKTKKTIPRPVPELRDGYVPDVQWDAGAYKFTVDYFEKPPEPLPEVSVTQLAQLISELEADLIIAGVIQDGKDWHERSKNNTVAAETLDRLADAGKISREDLVIYADERKKILGT